MALPKVGIERFVVGLKIRKLRGSNIPIESNPNLSVNGRWHTLDLLCSYWDNQSSSEINAFTAHHAGLILTVRN